MKKITILLIAAASALAVFSCTKEDTPSSLDSKITFTADFEQTVVETKTTLDNDADVLWVEDDQIKIFDNAGVPAVFVANEAGSHSSFDKKSQDPGFQDAESNIAFYPASAAQTINNGVVTFSVPDQQTYVDGTFGPGAAPAIASVNVSGELATMSFKNTMGVLKFKLKQSTVIAKSVIKVSKIVLTDANGAKLSGTFTASVSAPAATYVEGGSSSITLDCGNVQLSTDEENTFYFMVPAGTLANGFTAEIYDEDNYLLKTLSTTKTSFAAQRNYVRKVAVQEVSFEDLYTEGTYVDTNNGAYIKTGVNADQGDWTCEAKFSYNALGETCLLGCADVSGGDALNRIYFFNQGATTTTTSAAYGIGFARGSYYNPSSGGFTQLKPVVGTVYEIVSVNNNGTQTCTVNNTQYWNKTYSATVTTNEFYAFSDNRGGTAGKFIDCNCYYLNIMHNGDYVRKFIPVKRNKDNVAGMFDEVEGDFYSSASSTAFTLH